MEAETVSRTALLMSYLRGFHAAHDSPRIFDDHLAWALLSEGERAAFEQRLVAPSHSIEAMDPLFARSRPDEHGRRAWTIRTFFPLSLAVSRARAAEDALARAVRLGACQYVLVGAGLDTFAFRHRDLASRLRVFEVDHPATQAHKLRRLRELGWDVPEGVSFLPVDLAREGLASALGRSSYDASARSFFSWLGVTMYLTRAETFSTLGDITRMSAPGTEIVFDYFDADAFVPERASPRIVTAMEYTRRHGEPMRSGLDPATLATDLARVGLRLREDLGPGELEERYFRGRADGYHAYDHAHVARATIDDATGAGAS